MITAPERQLRPPINPHFLAAPLARILRMYIAAPAYIEHLRLAAPVPSYLVSDPRWCRGTAKQPCVLKTVVSYCRGPEGGVVASSVLRSLNLSGPGHRAGPVSM